MLAESYFVCYGGSSRQDMSIFNVKGGMKWERV
jgi:hypothetical protein